MIRKPAECQGHERIKTRLSPRDAFNLCTGLLLSHMLINVKLLRTIFANKISFPLCWLHIHVCIDLLTNSNICSLNTCLVLKERQCISRELLWFTVDFIKETTRILNWLRTCTSNNISGYKSKFFIVNASLSQVNDFARIPMYIHIFLQARFNSVYTFSYGHCLFSRFRLQVLSPLSWSEKYDYCQKKN